MRKFMDRTTVMAVVGFTAGYYVGRHYDVSIVFKKVAK